MFKLTVTKTVEIPEEERERRRRMGGYGYESPRTEDVQVLMVELSQDEWEQAKKAIIGSK